MKKIMFNDRYGLTEAVLNRRKTMTRRIVPQSVIDKYSMMEDFTIIDDARYDVGEVVAIAQPYKSIFDEDCHRSANKETIRNLTIKNVCDLHSWTNKLFVRADLMPHHIRIADVKVERLQDISDDDCLKEGIRDYSTPNERRFGFSDFNQEKIICFRALREAYAALIDRISGKGTWESSPYVFVYEFELVD